MDIVIALGTGSRWQDNELRYALRSIEKYLTGFGEIILVGERPKWINNIKHIPLPDKPGRKNYSIFRKILIGSHVVNENDFLFWNDDHFLLKNLDAKDFKYWYDGDCLLWAHKATGLYKRAITATNNLPGKNNYYTDIHVPIVYNKSLFANLEHLDWSQEYVIKSAYTKQIDGPFELMPDFKVNTWFTQSQWIGKLQDKLFFSIGSYAINTDFKILMEKLYPKKSKYEK